MRAVIVWVALAALTSAAAAQPYASHTPLRALPAASQRAATRGPVRHVDSRSGDDAGDGTAAHPWKTVQHGVDQLHAGDTLYLHAGVYFEEVRIHTGGAAEHPIIIRAAPGELAVIDAGLRAFYEAPQTAWQPVAGGRDEYESTATYPIVGSAGDVAPGDEDRGVPLTGNFADSMIPLHGYKLAVDFHAATEYWTMKKPTTPGKGVYLGPGLWFDYASQRIHIRLTHTTLASQGANNYTGETDPRKLQLVVGYDRSALVIDGATHIAIQDLVVRGSSVPTVRIEGASDVDVDGVTIYGGSPALYVNSTAQFRLHRSAMRGLAAPWSSRASMKYRGDSPYLFSAGHKGAQSTDWDVAYNEFTDSHDGIVLDSIKKLRFHHNRIDNFNDDGIYLTLPPRDSLPEDEQLYENYVTRVYTTLAFAQHRTESNAIGPGVYIFRNVFDLRDGTYAWVATDAEADAKPTGWLPGRMCGDHSSPTWEPLYIYNNTIITAGPAWRDYYGAQLVQGTKGSVRRVFDNLFVQLAGDPGLAFPSTSDDIQVDGNLLWGAHGTAPVDGFFDRFRASKVFEASKQVYPPGFGAHDLHADPRLADLGERGTSLDARLQPGSPAIDAGVAIPSTWPDTLRGADKGKPDIGALPYGVAMLAVGPAAAPRP